MTVYKTLWINYIDA